MEKQKMVNLFHALGGIKQEKDFDTSFDCNLEKMQELKNILDALGIEYSYKVNEGNILTQYVIIIDCVDIPDYIRIYAHQFHLQGL